MLMKTHLIVTSQEDEFEVKYVEYLRNVNPQFNSDNLPTFVIITSKGRMEIHTFDIMRVIEMTKKYTYPRGRESITIDKGYIYIKTVDKGEVLMTIVIHKHIKHYAPMFDDISLD